MNIKRNREAEEGMSDIELKPCPFCHGKMKVDYKLFPFRYAIVHVSKFYFYDMCYGGTDYEYETENEAVEAWNRRVE